ncbi:MAG: rhodanese-like domain-containing protein [Flavobacteriaceae bacterium]|jgi:rhodanese-related sulfurtransferase|nr:rhodanese-like domain-containing protein [Flavobacteriaceae bacterium]
MLNNLNYFIKNTLIALTIICSCIILSCKGQTDSRIKNISVEDMQSLLKTADIQLIDVRTPEEYQSGFIKNAENINYFSPSFEEEILKLDRDKPIILYCRSGNRSSKSAVKFLNAGFLNLYNLDGGILNWQKQGLDVIKE